MYFHKVLAVLVVTVLALGQAFWLKGKAKVDKTNVLLPPRIFYVSEPVYIPMPIPQVPAVQLMTPVSPDVGLPEQYPTYNALPAAGNGYPAPAAGNGYPAPATGTGYNLAAGTGYNLAAGTGYSAAGNGYPAAGLPAVNSYGSLPAYGTPNQNYPAGI